MKLRTLSFPTFSLPSTVRDVVDPRNCVGPQHCAVSYLLTRFLHIPNQNRSFSWILSGCRERWGRVLIVGSSHSSSIVSPQQPPSAASLSSLDGRVQVLRQLCLTTICSQIDRMYTYTEIYIIHALLWCSESCDCNNNKMPCDWVRTTAMRIRHQVSCSAAQRSRLLLKSPTDLRRGHRSSKHSLFYKSNLVASWECSCNVWEHIA